QYARAALVIGGQQHACGELLGGSEVRFERFGQRRARQRDNPLVAHAALLRLHRDRKPPIGPDQLAKKLRVARRRGNCADSGSVELRHGRSRKSWVHWATSSLTAPFP